jgi:hypothetical protein
MILSSSGVKRNEDDDEGYERGGVPMLILDDRGGVPMLNVRGGGICKVGLWSNGGL